MPSLQFWASAELWTLQQLQQCAINSALRHRTYQNTWLRPASKYRRNLGVCQNTAGALGLPDGASRLSAAFGRCRWLHVNKRRVWFDAGLAAAAPLRHSMKKCNAETHSHLLDPPGPVHGVSGAERRMKQKLKKNHLLNNLQKVVLETK